jgi:hypothetical protein
MEKYKQFALVLGENGSSQLKKINDKKICCVNGGKCLEEIKFHFFLAA